MAGNSQRSTIKQPSKTSPFHAEILNHNKESINAQQKQNANTRNFFPNREEKIPNAPRINYGFLDINETMKAIVAKQYVDDDNYIGVQATVNNSIVGTTSQSTYTTEIQSAPTITSTQQKTTSQKSFKDWYIVFDTRQALPSSDPANGQYAFDLGPFMQQMKTSEYNLSGVVQMTISPFTIPAVQEDESYTYGTLGLRIQEITSSIITSAMTEAPTHFQFSFVSIGTNKLQLTPILPPNGVFIIQQPVLLDTVTFTFTLPLSYNSTVSFPPSTFIATYNGVGLTTTIFNNLLGVQLVVGDVLYFSSSDPVLVANNPAFFNQKGHFIDAVLPLQFEIAGVYNLVGGIPGVTQVTATAASSVIRIPMKFKVVYDGGTSNFITAISS